MFKNPRSGAPTEDESSQETDVFFRQYTRPLDNSLAGDTSNQSNKTGRPETSSVRDLLYRRVKISEGGVLSEDLPHYRGDAANNPQLAGQTLPDRTKTQKPQDELNVGGRSKPAKGPTLMTTANSGTLQTLDVGHWRDHSKGYLSLKVSTHSSSHRYRGAGGADVALNNLSRGSGADESTSSFARMATSRTEAAAPSGSRTTGSYGQGLEASSSPANEQDAASFVPRKLQSGLDLPLQMAHGLPGSSQDKRQPKVHVRGNPADQPSSSSPFSLSGLSIRASGGAQRPARGAEQGIPRPERLLSSIATPTGHSGHPFPDLPLSQPDQFTPQPSGSSGSRASPPDAPAVSQPGGGPHIGHMGMHMPQVYPYAYMQQGIPQSPMQPPAAMYQPGPYIYPIFTPGMVPIYHMPRYDAAASAVSGVQYMPGMRPPAAGAPIPSGAYPPYRADFPYMFPSEANMPVGSPANTQTPGGFGGPGGSGSGHIAEKMAKSNDPTRGPGRVSGKGLPGPVVTAPMGKLPAYVRGSDSMVERRPTKGPHEREGRPGRRERRPRREESEGDAGTKTAATLLNELKANRNVRFELKDIQGHIFQFCRHQEGSRFIQQKLEPASAEEVTQLFEEVSEEQLRELMEDVFGNYVVQKLLEHGTTQQQMLVAGLLKGSVYKLSKNTYGCRVIQKALEVVTTENKRQIVEELRGSVLECVRDQNGNHVIQKCIECLAPSDDIKFMIDDINEDVVNLSSHNYGCRVVQRVLEYCTLVDEKTEIMKKVVASTCKLAPDQFGNYVIQHILEKGPAEWRSQAIQQLAPQVVEFSKHKFASNVVEKCLKHGGPAEIKILTEQVAATPEAILTMSKDMFANYVVQKVLEVSDEKLQQQFVNELYDHIAVLKKLSYGKHIASRVEKMKEAQSEKEEQ